MTPDQSPDQGPDSSDARNGELTPDAATAPTAPQDSSLTADAGLPRAYARPTELMIMTVIVVVDQLTKEIVRRTLPLHGEPAQLIPGFLDLTHVQNTGAAFGLLNAADFPYKAAVMIGIAGMALIAIAAYATQLGFHERLARVGLSLILGGAFGNLIDRAVFGHVVDFVDVYWDAAHFWAFNVADAAITIGAILVLLDMIGLGRSHASHPV
jgi:signal peptidase II